EELLTRALQICHLLGIPILVVHPIPGSIEENHHAFLPYLKAAEEFRVVLAFENLTEEGELTDIADLIALVERFASPFAGICYDTGHAHMCGHDLVKDIIMMGRHLVATHIADNKGRA